jgi:hypothetical protein
MDDLVIEPLDFVLLYSLIVHFLIYQLIDILFQLLDLELILGQCCGSQQLSSPAHLLLVVIFQLFCELTYPLISLS